MPDVMKERSGDNKHAVFIRMSEPPACNVGKEHGTERMFEPCVIGARIYEVRKSKLFDIAESLKRRGVQQGEQKILHFNISMDRVLDDLHKFTKRIFIYIA
jgi:hypothetical protein